MGRDQNQTEESRGAILMLDARATFDWIAEAEAKTEEALTLVRQMVAWFHENYEDRAESVPYRSEEGGYLCELYDAREEIGGHFCDPQDTFSEDEWEAIVTAAVDEVEGDATDQWAKSVPAPDVVRLLRAHDHYWGKGHVHLFNDDEDKTLCGKTLASCPGETGFGDQADITCKACLNKIKRKTMHTGHQRKSHE
jgi:hypothetical protein